MGKVRDWLTQPTEQGQTMKDLAQLKAWRLKAEAEAQAAGARSQVKSMRKTDPKFSAIALLKKKYGV